MSAITFGHRQRESFRSRSTWPLVAVGVLVAVVLGVVLVHRGATAAVAVLLAPTVAWFVISRDYGGLFLGLVLVLTIPATQTFAASQAEALRIAALLAAATILVSPRFRPRFIDGIVALFVIVTMLSWLLQYGHAGHVISIELTPLGFYIGARAVPAKRILLMMSVVLVAGTVGALSVIYEYARGSVIFSSATTYDWNATSSTIFRPGGIFGSPPGAATVMCFVILFGIAVAMRWRGRGRAFAIVCMVVCLLALVLTFTRAGMIALGIGLILFLWLTRSRLVRPLRVAWLLAALVAAYFVLLPGLQKNTTFQEGVVRPGNLTARQSYWNLALPIATSSFHNLVVGIGAGSLEGPTANVEGVPISSRLVTTPQVINNSLHDEYVTTLLEQGLIGLVTLVLMLGAGFLIPARAARRTRDPIPAAFAASIASMATVMTVGTSLLNPPSFAMLLVAIGLGVTYTAEPAVTRSQRRTTPRPRLDESPPLVPA